MVVESLGWGQRLPFLYSLLGVLANLQQRRRLRSGLDCGHGYPHRTFSHNMISRHLRQQPLRNTGISTWKKRTQLNLGVRQHS